MSSLLRYECTLQAGCKWYIFSKSQNAETRPGNTETDNAKIHVLLTFSFSLLVYLIFYVINRQKTFLCLSAAPKADRQKLAVEVWNTRQEMGLAVFDPVIFRGSSDY